VETVAEALIEFSPETAAWISAQAATTELRTISPKERSIVDVTLPPNQRTSPYAMTIMVRFLKMVKTGTERNWRALFPV
jgi:hypothetical protein